MGNAPSSFPLTCCVTSYSSWVWGSKNQAVNALFTCLVPLPVFRVVISDGTVPFSSSFPCGDHSVLWNVLLAVPSVFPVLHLILLRVFG